MTAVSVVVAVYNAQPWLDRFFASLQRQTLRDFEVVMVDDASTDQSAALIEKTAEADPRFRLVRLPVNSGAGTARNTGIMEARGETLCFADPDDLLPETSLEVRYTAYKHHNAIVRACHDEIGDDGSMRNHETRPDRLPELFSPVDEAERVGVNPFLCAHWTWLFPTELLRRHKIFNGEDMRTAEDIVLLNKLFFHIKRMVWIPDTVYLWMKHEESLSTTRYTAEHYENYFQCCDVFYREAGKHRRMELADQFFDGYLALYPGHLLAQAAQGASDELDAQKLIAATARIAERYAVFARCAEVLRRNPAHYAGLCRLMAVLQSDNQSALLRLVESQRVFNRLMEEKRFEGVRAAGWSRQVSFDKLDRETGLVRARYLFCDNGPEERFVSGGRDAQPAYAKNRTVHTGNGYVIFERILWLPLPPDGDERIALTVGGQDSGLNHTASQLRAAFAPRPLNDAGFPPDVRALRRLAASPAVREKFRDAWLFIDKDCEADDNAEHLYRYVRTHHPEVNAWYVLARDSRDWPRLEAEGFRLVGHGEMEHHALYLNCAKLVSSQMDCYIFRPLEERYFTDYPGPQFVCLPHGVTKDDVSGWFNSIPFDLFVAATRDEAKSITADGTPYVMSAKEVRLGGFPRYDKWMEPVERENIVFIMPTWRADLVGEWDGKGQKRARNPNFQSSKFVRMWKELFDDPRMAEMLARKKYRVVFFAHPCFEDYVGDMPFPDFVEKRSKAHGSMIDIMRKSKVMITDFSSVAYDMAYMRSPVVYYQYEDKDEFTRSQKWVSGYIDYETMGFGPVCRDRDALFRDLEAAMDADGVMPEPYRTRAEKTFAHHDADCCRRAYDFISEASRPFNAAPKDD
jgi:glycosyltransferase involved in cell wall biosynthesis